MVYKFSYSDKSGKKINYTVENELTLDDIFEDVKNFLVATGYPYNSVNIYQNHNEDNDILRDRIRSALDSLEENNIERAKEYLNNALI